MSIPLIYQGDVVETFPVKRTQRIHHSYNEEISYFAHLSKNLWNQAHHLIYGYYKKYGHIPSYEELDGILNNKNYYKDKDGKINPDYDNYHKLGGATAQQILKVYINAWISYLKGIKGYFSTDDSKKDNYTGKPKEPGYKKKDGEFELIFTNEQIKFRETKNGNVWMTFPKKIDNKPSKLKDLKILLGNVNDLDPYLLKRLMWGKFDQVRIIPKGTGYWIEIVYNEEIMNKEVLREKYKLNKDIIMTVDLGVENIIAITDNIGSQPIIIKSEIWKAENQWYNKRRSELSSIYDRNRGFGTGCFLKRDKKGNSVTFSAKADHYVRYLVNKNGKKIQILTDNRNNFVMDSEHKLGRFIIERALDIRARTVVFTRNPLWKQNINIGKRNNQNFVQIPHKKLIDKTRYKGKDVGIDVLDFTEEYTSKCSFLDSESLEHHDVYIGKRIHRGLFISSKGIDISTYIGSKKQKVINTINADVQGAYNLLRKVDPKFNVYDIIEGVAVHGLVPERLSISELMTKNYRQLRMNHRLIVGGINNINC